VPQPPFYSPFPPGFAYPPWLMNPYALVPSPSPFQQPQPPPILPVRPSSVPAAAEMPSQQPHPTGDHSSATSTGTGVHLRSERIRRESRQAEERAAVAGAERLTRWAAQTRALKKTLLNHVDFLSSLQLQMERSTRLSPSSPSEDRFHRRPSSPIVSGMTTNPQPFAGAASGATAAGHHDSQG
jgi:hypothetical protein